MFLGWVFNFKLGSFVLKKCNCRSSKQPLLELKTRPWFFPASWSLCMLASFWSNRFWWFDVDVVICFLVENLLTEKHLAYWHFNDRHLADRHLANWHFDDKHLADRHLSNWHFNDQLLAGRHLANWHFDEKYLANWHFYGKHLADRHLANWHFDD